MLQTIQLTLIAIDIILAIAHWDEADSSICLMKEKCKLAELMANASRIENTVGFQCAYGIKSSFYE